MLRPAVRAAAIALLLLIAPADAAAQSGSPLLGNENNCSEAQDAFGGQPQPASAGQNVSVQLATECFLVVSIEARAGQTISLSYVSGQYSSLNIAFYEAAAPPGGAFSDPPDVRLGTTGTSRPVPGDGGQTVMVALQGVGGPRTGSSSIRLDLVDAPPPTTTTTVPPSTVPPTTVPPTTVGPTSTVLPSTAAPTSAAVPTTAPATIPATVPTSVAGGSAEPSTDGQTAAAVETSTPDEPPATAESDGRGIPWWVLGVAVGGAIAWLTASAIRARRPAAPLPWDRSVLTWTLQHTPPTGSCSSSARALVDPDDDGTLAGYTISTLFALPSSGKKIRATIGDPLLAQLEALWATQPSGAELRSAVDAYVNALCHHLDKKVRPSATLLAELTKADVVVHGQVHACVDGGWQMFEGWRDVPELPAGQVQHDIVQVAVLGVGAPESNSWLDRVDAISDAITALIDTRRAPAGLWVFD